MALNYILPLRLAQGILSIIILGLTAWVIDVWNGPRSAGWSPSEVNFMLFTSIWTLLAVAYLVVAPARFPQFAHKFGILAAEFVTMIFWFAAFIAVAVLWTDLHCGSHGGICGGGTAATVFAAFEWVLFAFSTTVAGLHVWRTRNTHDSRHNPEMEVHPGV